MTYLEDQSANGTFVNDRVVGKGRKIPLAHVAKIALSLPHNKGRQSLLGIPKKQEARKTYFCHRHTAPLSTFVLWGSRATANSEAVFHSPGTPHMPRAGHPPHSAPKRCHLNINACYGHPRLEPCRECAKPYPTLPCEVIEAGPLQDHPFPLQVIQCRACSLSVWGWIPGHQGVTNSALLFPPHPPKLPSANYTSKCLSRRAGGSSDKLLKASDSICDPSLAFKEKE